VESDRPSPHITGLPAPLSELPWSADFVMQAIEVLPVTLRDAQLLCLRPEHADSFIVGWPARAKPEEVALRAVAQTGLESIVLHSTSWRQAGEEVILTYLAVVSPPASRFVRRWRASYVSVVITPFGSIAAAASPPAS